MSFIALGLKVGIKGISGLFRSAKTLIKDFKDKRKGEANAFKDNLLAQAGQMGIGAIGDSINPNNPLGVTASPQKASIETMEAGSGAQFVNRPFSGIGGKKGIDKKTMLIIGGAIVGLLAILKLKK